MNLEVGSQIIPKVKHLLAQWTLMFRWSVPNHVLLQAMGVCPDAADFTRDAHFGTCPTTDRFVGALDGQTRKGLPAALERARKGRVGFV